MPLFNRPSRKSRPSKTPSRNYRRNHLRAELLEDRRLLAGDWAVFDINSDGSRFYGKPIEVAGTTYMFAADSEAGVELHALNPTTNELELVVDVNPGLTDSFGHFNDERRGESPDMVAIGELLYFNAFDPLHGFELRELNVRTGSLAVFDVAPGFESSNAGFAGGLEVMDGQLFFSATDPVHGRELRKLQPATHELTTFDINPGASDSDAGLQGGFESIGSNLFFSATTTNSSGYRLHRLQATDAVVGEVDLGIGSYAGFADRGVLKAVGNDLVFSVYVAGSGYELGVYDTETSSFSLIDIAPGSGSSFPGSRGIEALANRVFFDATTTGQGVELFTVNLIDLSLQSFDIREGAGSSNPREFHAVGDVVAFASYSQSYGDELHFFDPADESITVVDISSGGGGSGPEQFTVVGEKLYFRAIDSMYGSELRVFDPIQREVATIDIAPGSSSSRPVDIASAGEDLFAISEIAWKDYQLWQVNTSTYQLQNIEGNVSADSSRAGSTGIIEANSKVFFTASDDEHGTELRAVTSDGSGFRTFDILPGSTGSNPSNLYLVDDQLFFQARTESIGVELVAFNTLNETWETIDVNPGTTSSHAGATGFSQIGDELYFYASGPRGIHSLDLVSGTTRYRAEVAHAGRYSGFASIGEELYFTAQNPSGEYELMVLDTRSNALSTIGSFTSSSGLTAPGADMLVAINGLLYFSAWNEADGYELRVWNPADRSVSTVDINPGSVLP